MKYLLDTNTCICYLNGSSEKLRNEFENHFFTDFVICSIVKAELLFGAFKSARVEENLKRIKTFLYPFLSLPFDDKAALHYAKTRNHLEKSGKLIGPNDLLIASIAVSNNLILVTHNTREFSRVDGLKIEDWEA